MSLCIPWKKKALNYVMWMNYALDCPRTNREPEQSITNT